MTTELPPSYRGLRDLYRPPTIEVLFVGESPPPPGESPGERRFFYSQSLNADHDHLYRAIMEALYAGCSEVNPDDKATTLERFRQDGFWLVDMLDFPVSLIWPRSRDNLLDAVAEETAAWLVDLRPRRGVIICLKRVYERIDSLLEGTPARALHKRHLPFPHPEGGEEQRQAFVRGVRHAVWSTGAWNASEGRWARG